MHDGESIMEGCDGGNSTFTPHFINVTYVSGADTCNKNVECIKDLYWTQNEQAAITTQIVFQQEKTTRKILSELLFNQSIHVLLQCSSLN